LTSEFYFPNPRAFELNCGKFESTGSSRIEGLDGNIIDDMIEIAKKITFYHEHNNYHIDYMVSNTVYNLGEYYIMVSNLSSHILHFPLEIEKTIINDFGGFYKPDFEKVQQNLNASEEELQAYLWTYFPRSFVEAYRIFEDLISDRDIINNFNKKNELYILDIGSGTGGNILGLLWIMKKSLKNFRHKRIHITSIDGNDKALKIQKRLVKTFFPTNTIITSKKITITRENITKKLKIVLNRNKFDIIMSFKFVNEFYRGDFIFSRNEIPGKENDRVIESLKKNFGLNWLTKAEIKKTDSGDIICVFNKNDSFSFKLNNDEKNVILTYKGKINDVLIARMDSGNLKIYRDKYTENKGMYKIITETVSKNLDKNGLFILSDVTDSTPANLFLPNIMNKEIIDYLNGSPNLRLILPLSCAFWFKYCRANRCFTKKEFIFRINDPQKEYKSGISYKIFANKNTANRILEHIEKQNCYRISRGRSCRRGHYDLKDIHSEEHTDAFSFNTSNEGDN